MAVLATTAFWGLTWGQVALTGASLAISYYRSRQAEELTGESQTYGFGPISNTKSHELPIPIIYGRNLIAGNVIHQKIWGEDNHKMLMFVGIGEGPISDIQDVMIRDISGSRSGDQYTFNGSAAEATIHTGEQSPSADSLYSDETFPFTAYIATKLDAKELELSSTPTITSIVQGRTVKQWTGSDWTSPAYSNNPVWCTLDFLLNKRYGIGLSEDAIDLDSFLVAANYCDENVDGESRFELDYIIDRKRSALDVLQEMTATYRGMLIYNNGEIQMIIDTPTVPTQAFSDGSDGRDVNIKDGTFQSTQSSYKDIPNRVNVEYTDPQPGKEWGKVIAQYTDDKSIERDGEVREQTFTLHGINRFKQAGRQARYLLKNAKYCDYSCSFEAGVDAVSCMVGDVITVSHEIKGWVDKKFRVMEMKESEDDEVEIALVEYNEAVYSDDGVVEQLPQETTLPNPFEAPSNVTGLTAIESGELLGDGTYTPAISLSWTNPEEMFFENVDIYYKLNADASWTFAGNTEDEDFTISPVSPSKYDVKVVSRNRNNISANFGDAPTDTITINGNENPPPDPTWATCSFNDAIILQWHRVTNEDIAGYEIRTVDANWGTDNSELVYRGDSLSHIIQEPDSVSYTFYVKAINNSGVYSANATSKSLTNAVPPQPSLTVSSTLSYLQLSIDNPDIKDFKYTEFQVDTSDDFSDPTIYKPEDIEKNVPAINESTHYVRARVVDKLSQEGPWSSTETIVPNLVTREDMQGAIFQIQPESSPDPGSGDLEDLWDMDTTTGPSFSPSAGEDVVITFTFPMEWFFSLCRFYTTTAENYYVEVYNDDTGTWVEVLGSAASPETSNADAWTVEKFEGAAEGKMYVSDQARITFVDPGSLTINELKFWTVTLADEILAQVLTLTGSMKIQNEDGGVFIDANSIRLGNYSEDVDGTNLPEPNADVTSVHAGDINHIGAAAPDSPQDGWMWLDTSTSPDTLKKYNGTSWDDVGTVHASWSGVYDDGSKPEDGADVTADHQSDINLSNLGSHVFPSGSSFPGSPENGELFFRTDEDQLYRYSLSNTSWYKADINLVDADDVDETSSKKWAGESGADVTSEHASDVIYYGSSAPGHKAGRLWYDTSVNKFKRSDGSSWNTVGDETALHETFSSESDIDVLLTTNAPAEAGADTTASNPQAWDWISGSKPEQDADKTAAHALDISHYGTSYPASPEEGWLCVRTDKTPVTLERYDGSSWNEVATFGSNWSDVVDDGSRPADGADVTADNAQAWDWISGSKPEQDADKTADHALDISHYGTSAPASPEEGWLWVDTDESPVELKRYDGSSWNIVATLEASWSGVVDDGSKPADNADVTDYTDTRVSNALEEESTLTISRPVGASYSAGSGTTGAIVITLPQSWTSTMMYFAVDVYNYSTSKSFTLHIGGYNFSGDSSWKNTSVNLVGGIAANNRVRFGHDGSKCCVVIGNTDSTWRYPKVTVHNFQAGHSNYQLSKWNDGWSISTETDLSGYSFDKDFSDSLIDAKAIKDQGDLATTDEADADVLNMTNAPNEAGADVTGNHQGDINIDNVSDGTTYKKYLSTEKTKLSGVEDSADVTADHADEVIYRGNTPPSHKSGRVWYCLENASYDNYTLYKSTGSAWEKIGDETAQHQADIQLANVSGDADGISEGASNKFAAESGADVTKSHALDITHTGGSAPSSPQEGWVWHDTSTNPDTLKRYNGSSWVKVATIDGSWSLIVDDGNKPEDGADVTGDHTSKNQHDFDNGPDGTAAGGDIEITTSGINIYNGKIYIESADGKTKFFGDRWEVYDEDDNLRVKIGKLS